jgi:hypothetical protein
MGKMKVPVNVRVHRILKKLSRFRACDRIGDLPQLATHRPPLGADEALQGVYENAPGSEEQAVFFTDLAVHWRANGEWSSVKYEEVVGIAVPQGDKMDAAELLLETRAGTTQRLPIRGGTEVTRDVYEVWRFMMRMTEDRSWKK